ATSERTRLAKTVLVEHSFVARAAHTRARERRASWLSASMAGSASGSGRCAGGTPTLAPSADDDRARARAAITRIHRGASEAVLDAGVGTIGGGGRRARIARAIRRNRKVPLALELRRGGASARVGGRARVAPAARHKAAAVELRGIRAVLGTGRRFRI